jgi:bacterioferritin-associated ferredoxin
MILICVYNSNMIICVCNRVSDHDIKQAVFEGCCSIRQLQEQTGLGTQCGRCYEAGAEVFESLSVNGAHSSRADSREYTA